MRLQHLFGTVRLAAQSALVESFTKMSHLMQFQDVIVSKVLAADITDVGSLSSVRPRMHFQLFGTGETFGTDAAHVGLLTRVAAHVDDQLTRLNERLTAIGTLMRSLTCVDPHVPVQFAAVFKAPVAVRTSVRFLFGVNAPVHRQVLLHRKRLTTDVADERPLTCVRSVVPCQPGWNSERFGANVAPMHLFCFTVAYRANVTFYRTTTATSDNQVTLGL